MPSEKKKVVHSLSDEDVDETRGKKASAEKGAEEEELSDDLVSMDFQPAFVPQQVQQQHPSMIHPPLPPVVYGQFPRLDVESLRRELGLVHLRCHRHFPSRASLLREFWLVQHSCQKCHSHR
jgi:hypothetical protein